MLTFTLCPGQSCQQKLEDAKRAWFNGQFQEVEALLSGCLNGELAKEDRFDAYKLMVDTKLLQNEEAEADIYMEKLLALDPNYQTREVDLAEFKQLYSTYDLRTKYLFGISAGALFPNYVIMHHHSRAGDAEEPSSYEQIPGYSFGITGDMQLYRNLYFNGSVLYSKRGYSDEEKQLGFRIMRADVREYYIELPLQFRYGISLNHFKVFLGFGYALSYLVKAKANLQHTPQQGLLNAYYGDVWLISDYDITNQRNQVTHNWIASGGIHHPIQDFLVEVKVSYQRGLSNVIDDTKRYDDPILLDEYAFVPDDYKVNHWVISIGFMRNIIHPQKK
jgi:hypothetical protein